MKRLVIFRHAHSVRQQLEGEAPEATCEGISFSELPEVSTPLSQLGFEQRNVFADYVLNHVYPNGARPKIWLSSPYLRALQTVATLKFGIPELVEALAELNQGELTNVHPSLRENCNPEAYRKWKDNPYYGALPGGESLHEVFQRVWQELASRRFTSQDMAIACHEKVMWLIRQGLEGIPVTALCAAKSVRNEGQLLKNCSVLIYSDTVPQGEVVIPDTGDHFASRYRGSPFRFFSIVNPLHVPREDWDKARVWREI